MAHENSEAVDDQEDREINARQAGHVLYNSISTNASSTRDALLHSGSYQSGGTVALPEDQLACCGIMSPVRRTFCLLVLFDFILTFILWLIFMQVSNHSLDTGFTHEVKDYSFRSSLFDTVLCAAWRFAPLLLAYALFKLNNTSVIAITTFGTCVFLVCKAFLFEFNNYDNVICYLLLIFTFIIAWIETWFLDFKVLPREQKARERAALERRGTEREPLLSNAANRHRWPTGEEYYSPVESEKGSDDEGTGEDFRSVPGSRTHSRHHSRGSNALSLGSEEQDYLQTANKVWDQVWDMCETDDDWKLEAGTDLETGSVHSRSFPDVCKTKIYRLQGYLECPVMVAFEELVLRVVQAPSWTSTVLECKKLHIVDECTDIIYTVAAEAAGGLVSSRDFVTLRHWVQRRGIWVASGSAVSFPTMQPTKKHVRGENGPGGWVIKPVPGVHHRCIFISYLNTDLKGWLPQYVVDQALSSVLMDYMNDIRKHMSDVMVEMV